MKVARKVTKIGDSFRVVVPIEVVKEIGVRKGDVVLIDFLPNKKTMTVEFGKEAKQ